MSVTPIGSWGPSGWLPTAPRGTLKLPILQMALWWQNQHTHPRKFQLSVTPQEHPSFPDATCTYFILKISFSKLKHSMWEYVNLGHSKHTKGKFQTFFSRCPSPWAGWFAFSFLHPLHFLYTCSFSCISLASPGNSKHLIGIPPTASQKMNASSTACKLPSPITLLSSFLEFQWCLLFDA